jgi:hypothetical protein
VIRAEGWCAHRASMMRALAFGVLDPGGERYRLAVAHQRECPACRRYVLSLRGLAAILPPLALPVGVGGAVGAGAAVGARAGGAGGGAPAAGGFTGKLAAGAAALGLAASGALIVAGERSRTTPQEQAGPARSAAAVARGHSGVTTGRAIALGLSARSASDRAASTTTATALFVAAATPSGARLEFGIEGPSRASTPRRRIAFPALARTALDMSDGALATASRQPAGPPQAIASPRSSARQWSRARVSRQPNRAQARAGGEFSFE